MIDSGSEYKEIPNIIRVTVVPEFTCGKNKYLLLIKNKSRNEWELPGGGIEQGETLLAAARREFAEEVALPEANFSFQEIPTAFLSILSTQPDPYHTKAKTSRGNDVVPKLVLARTQVAKLPDNPPLSPEHSGFMFIKIPGEWGKTHRQDYLAQLYQFESRKLVLARKHQGQVYKLCLTHDPYKVEGRPHNISRISGLALSVYIQASFLDQI